MLPIQFLHRTPYTAKRGVGSHAFNAVVQYNSNQSVLFGFCQMCKQGSLLCEDGVVYTAIYFWYILREEGVYTRGGGIWWGTGIYQTEYTGAIFFLFINIILLILNLPDRVCKLDLDLLQASTSIVLLKRYGAEKQHLEDR